MTLVAVKDSSAKTHYQYINYKGKFIDSPLRRNSQHRVWRLEVSTCLG